MRTIVVVQAEEAGKQQQHNNSQYLEKIIDILQSSPLLAYRQVRFTCVLVCSLRVVTQFVERVTRQREKVLSQAPSTLRRRNLKTEVTLWKCNKCFAFTLRRSNLKKEFTLWKRNKCFSSTLRRNLKTEVTLWKRIKCFVFTLRRRNLKTWQSPGILDMCFKETRAGKSHDYLNPKSSFFRPH